MTIADWRTEIDEIDIELLRLLNRRARLAAEIGAIKRAAGVPVPDPEREREVIMRLCRANAGPLDERAVARLFRHVIRESKRVEERAVEELGSPRAGVLR